MDTDKRVAEWAGTPTWKVIQYVDKNLCQTGSEIEDMTADEIQAYLISDEGSMAIMRAFAGTEINVRVGKHPDGFFCHIRNEYHVIGDYVGLGYFTAPTLNAAILEAAREYVKEKP